jgi:hypothetical protein
MLHTAASFWHAAADLNIVDYTNWITAIQF